MNRRTGPKQSAAWPDIKILGDVIRRRRKAAGFETQKAFADAAGVHLNYVQRVEKGRANPSFTVLDDMLTALDITWSEFGRFLDYAKRTHQ